MNQILKVKFSKSYRNVIKKKLQRLIQLEEMKEQQSSNIFIQRIQKIEINYSLAQFTLESGKKSKLHKIKSSEIYYILQGIGDLEINKEQFHLKKDDSMYVPPNSEQFIKNTGTVDLVFLCIVEPAWKIEDENILE